MFYRLFGWGIRQITDFFEDLWHTKKLDIPVPSFGHLSDLLSTVPLKVRQFCDKLAKRIAQGESIALIFDSTGLRFGKASHWYQTKYGKPCTQTPWRKLHMSMDPQMNVHGVEITGTEVSDIEIMSDLIPEEIAMLLEKVVADGGYYSKEVVEELYNKGIIPAIPPPHMLLCKEKRTRSGTIRLFNISRTRGLFMRFIKSMDMG